MDDKIKRKQSFLLRLPLSTRERAIRLATEEGTSLNFFISMAVAEKITQLETRRVVSERPSPVRTPVRQEYPKNTLFGSARQMMAPAGAMRSHIPSTNPESSFG